MGQTILFVCGVVVGIAVAAALFAIALYRRYSQRPIKPRGCPDFCAVVMDGERVAETTTDRNRARALAVQIAAEGKRCMLVRYSAEEQLERFDGTGGLA